MDLPGCGSPPPFKSTEIAVATAKKLFVDGYYQAIVSIGKLEFAASYLKKV